MPHRTIELTEPDTESTRVNATKMGVSTDTNTERAVRSVLEQVSARTAAVTLVFYSPEYDSTVVAEILHEYTGSRGIGGSTAGELSELGFLQGAMVAFSISADAGRASIRALGNVDGTSLVPFRSLTGDLAEALELAPSQLDPNRHVLLGLFDGLGSREDLIVPFLAQHTHGLPLVGGSLGDGARMERATLVHDGQVHDNAVGIILLEYDRPFELIHHSHHRLSETTFEVTGVRQSGRTIETLNGERAVDAYAAALGVEPIHVDDAVSGAHPLGRRFKGRPFPVSVMKANADGSLLMAAGVQSGESLHLLEPGDLVESTREYMAASIERFETAHGHKPETLLAFHCLGRFQEADRSHQLSELFEALHQLPLVGLNTYGEQLGSMHMNHSLTAILFG